MLKIAVTGAVADAVAGAGTVAGTVAGAVAGVKAAVFRDVAWGREELMKNLTLSVG